METALGVWARLRATGGSPSTDTLNARLTACVGCGQGERALRLLREAQALGARTCAHMAACPLRPCQQALLLMCGALGCAHLRTHGCMLCTHASMHC